MRIVALDRLAVESYPDLSQEQAIETVLADRSQEIAEDARFNQLGMKAATSNDFAI